MELDLLLHVRHDAERFARRAAPRPNVLDACANDQGDHVARAWMAAFVAETGRRNGRYAPVDAVAWLRSCMANATRKSLRRLRREVDRVSLTDDQDAQMDVMDDQVALDVRVAEVVDAERAVRLLRAKMPPLEMGLLERVAAAASAAQAYKESPDGSRRLFYKKLARAQARARRIVEAAGQC
jgi:DNA-directed RNA polymerase specialized sigma24 family protein